MFVLSRYGSFFKVVDFNLINLPFSIKGDISTIHFQELRKKKVILSFNRNLILMSLKLKKQTNMTRMHLNELKDTRKRRLLRKKNFYYRIYGYFIT